MNIKDYLHLYLGCEVEYTASAMKHTLIGIERDMVYICGGTASRHVVGLKSIKPILRPLSDITDAEKDDFSTTVDNRHWTTDMRYQAAKVRWHLEQHFDLFGLIEAGLAIDATKLTTTK